MQNKISNLQNHIKKYGAEQPFPIYPFPNPRHFFPPINPPAIQTVHQIFTDLLGSLNLSNGLRSTLNKRNFTDERIERLLMREIPSPILNLVVCSELSKKYSLTGVCGFEQTINGGWRLAINRKWGLLAAVRDSQGYVRALRLFRSLNDAGIILKAQGVGLCR